MPKALFLAPYPLSNASTRCRLAAYVPFLEAAGWEVELRPFISDEYYCLLYSGSPGRQGAKLREYLRAAWRRYGDWSVLRRYDVIVLHRESFPFAPAWVEERVFAAGKPVVYDFDDALFLPPEGSRHPWLNRFRASAKVERIIRQARLTIAGNEYLARYARQFNRDVRILPTPVDGERYTPAAPRESAKPVIGWMGSTSTVAYLEMLAEPLRRLAERYDFTVQVVGGAWRCRGVQTFAHPWSLAEELADLRSFDIGIMPLPDTPWARGKCGFKLLLYMSVGLPVVASPVGVNQEIVEHNQTGFHAPTPQAWEEHLAQLLTSPDLRRTMGIAGRKNLEARYSLQVCAPKFVQALHDALTK